MKAISNCYVFANVCEKYGIVWMDAAKYAKASLIDAIHMDEENHEKLAKAIYEKNRRN